MSKPPIPATPLLIITPSRTRPDNVQALIGAFRETVTHGHTGLLIAVDDDDPQIEGYQRVEHMTDDDPYVEFVYGPRLRLGGTLNKLATERSDSHYAIGFMGDDHRPRTLYWDNYFLTALEQMGYGFVYGNDLYQGQRLPTQVVMTADIIDAMGYMVPRGCTHLFFDNAWLKLGQELRKITYLPNVIIEHMHPVAGKSAMDELYAEVNSNEMWRHDEAVFMAWCRDELPDAVRRIESYYNSLREDGEPK